LPRPESVQGWLRGVWAVDAVADAIGHASPVLAQQVKEVCAGRCPEVRKSRRVVLAMARYLLRMTGRATPFGLFAGVASASAAATAPSRGPVLAGSLR
jgi:hypothetical protein